MLAAPRIGRDGSKAKPGGGKGGETPYFVGIFFISPFLKFKSNLLTQYSIETVKVILPRNSFYST